MHSFLDQDLSKMGSTHRSQNDPLAETPFLTLLTDPPKRAEENGLFYPGRVRTCSEEGQKGVILEDPQT